VKLGALGIPSYRSFSLVELEAATNNFENSHLLGQDSHGEVWCRLLGCSIHCQLRAGTCDACSLPSPVPIMFIS